MTNAKSEAPAIPPPNENPGNQYRGPCLVAALVWLMLSLYMFYVVPLQLDVREQLAKPEQLRAGLPAALRFTLFICGAYGTAAASAIGIIGCGIAYARRSARVANRMIVLGALCLGALVWVVLSSLPNR